MDDATQQHDTARQPDSWCNLFLMDTGLPDDYQITGLQIIGYTIH